jgi:3-methyladenine DNA glycosylase AlkD
MTRPDLDRAAALLADHLAGAGDPAVRDHWERYMRGTARFRGVPMAGIRAAVRAVRRSAGLDAWAVNDQLDLAQRWFAAEASEDKLAAVLLIAEHLAPLLEDGHAERLVAPLAGGDVADWNVCDWYAVKALHRFLVPAGDLVVEGRAHAVASWASREGLWLRRASVVAFVGSAPSADRQFRGYVELVLSACAANLVSDERFAHTGPGWVLRELSRVAPDAVRDFVDAHPELSPEGRRMALARLRPGPYRRR